MGALSTSTHPAVEPVVRVVPDVPGLSKQFDYTVPGPWRDSVSVGTRVRLVLHGRRVGGWVVATGVDPPGGVTLRPIEGIAGPGPPPGLTELARWAAWRWAGTVASFLRAASPERRVTELPAPPPVGGPEADVPAAGPASLVRLAPTADPLPIVMGVIDEARRSGRRGSVLVMVPSRGWAERMAGRLGRRGVSVASGWSEAAAGWPVVLGVRAAAWTPVPRLAAVVVLDAHDEAYQEERTPTAIAWAIAVERASRDGAPCTLVSPCPTAEQVHRFAVSAGDRSVERSGWPAVAVVDRRSDDPRTGLLSEALVELVRRSADHPRGPVVCVLNRRGRARLLACASCGILARCTRCGWPVETRASGAEATTDGSSGGDGAGDELACRRCTTVRPVVCDGCGAGRFKVLRPGVSRVREELEALLGTEVQEVTGAAPSTGAQGPPPDAPVVIGTEAVLHRVRRAAAVVFLEFDQHLLAPRFTAAEDALALVVRAGKMVGGRGQDGSGVVLVQTRIPDHAVIAAAVHGDPGPLTDGELEVRRQLALPPFAALALVSGPAAEEYCRRVATGDPEAVADPTGTLSVVPMGGERWLVRASGHQELCDRLASTPRPPGRLRVAVDPRNV
ncbi:MAG: primosomal protein N' family DNA-binding protein [Acidimicrobiales bacterium]